MRILSLSTLLLCLPVSAAAAQSVGGDHELLHQWRGLNSYDYLGNSVADAGDVNADGFGDLIVGAVGTDSGNSGSVYVYSGTDGTRLHRWDRTGNESFGYSVDGAGDVNADGYDDLIIGTRNADSPSYQRTGKAEIRSGLDGSLLYWWEGHEDRSQFGASVSGAGDVNADGFPDVIVGEPQLDSNGNPNAGKAFVYSGADGSLLYEFQGQMAAGLFGSSVSAAQDVNADGYDDVIIGQPGANLGSAFVFSGADGSRLLLLKSSVGLEEFGSSVSDAGDVNRDGYCDLIVGAPSASTGGLTDAGKAFVFSGLDGSRIYKWTGLATSENFGASVSGAGDVNLDGYADLIVGAPGDSSTGISNRGYASIYSGADGTRLYFTQGETGYSSMGSSVSGAGDVNQDGYADIIIGAEGTPAGSRKEAGAAYVHSFNPYLNGDLREVSIATGGTMNLGLTFPDYAAGYDYQILISKSGTGPMHRGIAIPLSLDAMVIATFQGNYPIAIHSSMQGTLDANGNGSASLTVSPGLSLNLIGRTFHMAAIASPSGQAPQYSSIAIPLTILP
jgi:FG-GAP repeat